MRRTVLLSTSCISLFCASVAWATTEVPATFDARTIAMGGAAAANTSNATAIYSNPAQLDDVKTMTATVALTPNRPVTTVPLAGPNTEVKADASFFPMFFAGGAYRVHERVVVGAAVYPTAGVGSSYEQNGMKMEMGIAMFEFNVPVALHINDQLSVAIGWRGTYLMQSAEMPMALPDGSALTMKQDLSGFSALGMQAGVAYRPMPNLRLGLSYRSKVNIDTSGTLEVKPAPDSDVDSSFSTPHAFRAGAALTLLEDTLTVALDVKYLMFKDSNKEMVLKVEGQPEDSITPLNWKDSLALGLGIEYKVSPMIAGRLGYSLTKSATPEETAGPFSNPPGIIHGIHGGAGLFLGDWRVDAGAMYAFDSKDISGQAGVVDGNYKLDVLMLSASGTYSF